MAPFPTSHSLPRGLQIQTKKENNRSGKQLLNYYANMVSKGAPSAKQRNDTMKIYAITPDFTGTSWPEACAKTAQLDADIQRLAKASGEQVHMRQYKEQMLGAPAVLVECEDSFLDKIRKLPLFDAVAPVAAATIRRSEAPQIEAPEATNRHKQGGPRR
jgi:hypothetical protein